MVTIAATAGHGFAKGIYYDARDLNLFWFKSLRGFFGFNSRREAKCERRNKVTRFWQLRVVYGVGGRDSFAA